ncbi:MAG: hypothetical protein Q8K58_03970 [Acidimicrobiales bacterium]|nr:hypothetical protein [Acidimicrobiales bacterium]
MEQNPEAPEAAVVGLPDERLVEVPAAAVRSADATTLEQADLPAWAKDRLADYKVPERFVAVVDLPRTGTSKVQKAALLDLFDAGDPAPDGAPAGSWPPVSRRRSMS